MLDKGWDFFVDTLQAIFVPLVCTYFALSSSIFLNTACNEATGIESFANTVLSPCHYLSGGQLAFRNEASEWKFVDRHQDRVLLSPKTAIYSILALPSFVAGVSLKTLSLSSPKTRALQTEMTKTLYADQLKPNIALYKSLQINLGDEKEVSWLKPLGLQRRPGEEMKLRVEKEALKEVGALLDGASIPWWVDCGTCLGVYRYGGTIPWDWDIDVGVLLPDFENIQKVLTKLDPKRYVVQDWSFGGSHPKSYIKIYVRESGTFIDVYHYDIFPERKEISYILSYEDSLIFPDFVKIRERRYSAPIAYDVMFPLQRAYLDDVVVNVPRDVVKYLQRCYGENLDPVKIYDPKTNQYERDLNHPYWQEQYAH